MEYVRNRLKKEFNNKRDFKKSIRQQSNLSLNGTHRSNENCDSYTIKQSEVMMDQPIYVGFAILEMSKLNMYET